jgi:hypothetical protein
MPRGPFDDIKDAMKLASRVLTAAEPLASLGQPERRAPLKQPAQSKANAAGTSSGCATCGGEGRVGAKGHEATCPSCEGVIMAEVYCATCAGTGLVGRKGHQVDCPVCT